MKVISYLLILLTGCSTSGPLFTGNEIVDQSDKAIVYLFRPRSSPVARSPEMKINNVVIGDLTSDGFVVLPLPPGQYRISFDWAWDTMVPDRNIVINFVKGKKYYLRINYLVNAAQTKRVDSLMDVGFRDQGTIKIVNESEALPMLKKCKRVTNVASNINISPLKTDLNSN